MLQQISVCAVLAALTGGATAFLAFPDISHPPALYHAPPAPYHPPPAPYHPPPAPYHPPEPHYPDVPPKYEYTYDVNDDYRKVMFDKSESRDGYKTAGSYSVRLPDGRKQIVTYTDSGDGLEAEVKYEGDIVVDPYHPPHPAPSYPKHPYFPPVYHPHPVPAAVQADPESEAPVEIAAVEEEDVAPVKIEEAPEEEAEVEEAVEEEPVVEETSAVEEEEQPVVEIAEVTTIPSQE